jgi:hypothetical protein
MPRKPKHPAVHLSVNWGYDITVDLRVSGRNWSKICKGQSVTIRGKGYYYEGDYFWDYWDFSGGNGWKARGEVRIAEDC